ncbi:hypothetical protein AX15_001606 [Amanita polypyramis BW_CC]|nr:hypothetical protein AX15_001606 [Amanita polypyramis BW_CC]
MTPTTLRRFLFLDHRNESFISLATVLSACSLQLTPAVVPTISTLATLLVYSRIVVPRPGTLKYGALLWLGLTIGGAAPKLRASLSALSSPGTSLIVLLGTTGATSLFSISAVFFDAWVTMRFSSPWSQITFFPSLWASLWSVVAYISPIGRLSAWSPTQGPEAYSWLIPLLGPAAIDWATAACAVVLSQAVAVWFMSGDSDLNFEPPVGKEIKPSQAQSSVHLGCILAVLAIPSFFITTFPAPITSDNITPFSVACVLPSFRRYEHHSPTLDDYIEESKTLTNSAKVLLWPESAVVFHSDHEKEVVFQKIRKAVTGPYVGVSFEETFTDPTDKTRSKGARRNGLALISKYSDEPHLVYYKRKLVPIAESFSLTHSEAPPDMFTINVPHPKDVNKTEWAPGPNFTRPLPITTSICLDFTDPSSFKDLSTRPALILAPARTWDIDIGIAMWEQAKQRAEELGTMILWCDGGDGGVSGVAGKGMNDVQQVGSGSWIRTVGVDYPHRESRTVYATYGGYNLVLFWLIVSGTSFTNWFYHFLPAGATTKRVYDGVTYAISRVRNRGERRPLVVEEQGALVDL